MVRKTKQNLSPNSAIKGGMMFGKISFRIIQPIPSPRSWRLQHNPLPLHLRQRPLSNGRLGWSPRQQ